MKSIFNSLGSNYNFSFVRLALRQIFYSDVNAKNSLHSYLEKNYIGKPFLFYKGRDAIEFSLRVLLGLDDRAESNKVLTQAFTCFAVEEGIKRAGATPVYVDIDKNSTNLTVETLTAIFAKNKDAKAVLVQHSLGIPADIIAIKKWCIKNNLLLIEDLAQGIGGVDSQGKPLGHNADAVIFSFGRDKIIDAISGGAVVFKNLGAEEISYAESILERTAENFPKSFLIKDMLYPLITSLGRKTHDVIIGKIIFKLARFFGLISSPTISKTSKLTGMNSAYAKLAISSFSKLEKQILNRRKLANYYFDNIDNSQIAIINTKKNVEQGSNLRFSIRVNDVSKLIKLMRKNKIYLSDRWYRSAVDCGRKSCGSIYKKGQASNAEKLTNEIFNLPTHQNISLDKASRIVSVLNKF
jgi:perosamine synthetase